MRSVLPGKIKIDQKRTGNEVAPKPPKMLWMLKVCVEGVLILGVVEINCQRTLMPAC